MFWGFLTFKIDNFWQAPRMDNWRISLARAKARYEDEKRARQKFFLIFAGWLCLLHSLEQHKVSDSYINTYLYNSSIYIHTLMKQYYWFYIFFQINTIFIFEICLILFLTQTSPKAQFNYTSHLHWFFSNVWNSLSNTIQNKEKGRTHRHINF